MDLDNQAAESGLDSGNAGGDMGNVSTPAAPTGLSLKDSLAKAATSVRERAETPSPAREEQPAPKTAFEPKPGTSPSSPPVQPSQPGEPASSILEAPKHWPQQRREAFAKYAQANPEFARDWLDHTKQLEGEFTRKAQEHADTRKFADSVRELFTPEHRSVMQANNINEAAAIKWLLDVDGYARKDPAGYAKWFMQQAGLTPQQLFPEFGQGQTQQADAEWIDPEITKTREELGSLKSTIGQLQSYIQQLESGRKAEANSANERIIQQFAEAKDAAGNLLHPHFGELEDRMAWELQNNPELLEMAPGPDKLKAAYDIAVWANPTTRQAMLEAEKAALAQSQALEAAEAQKRQAAERARSAQTIKPKVASVAGASPVKPTDLKSLIKDAASRARG